MENIAENVQKVLDRVSLAASKAGHDVTLVAASKTQTADAVKEALAAGITVFGENHAQELRDKFEAYGTAPVHMIGHMQTNKCNMVVGRASLIQTVDSLRLAAAIDAAAQRKGIVQDVLAEINIGREQEKSGMMPELLDEFLEGFAALPHLRLRGLMTIGPKPESPTSNVQYFEECYRLFIDKGQKTCNNIIIDTLSMGMSTDFEAAILSGANMVRVGTAIFGKRI